MLQDLPVVGIAPVFALASIVCTYNYITVIAAYDPHNWPFVRFIFNQSEN